MKRTARLGVYPSKTPIGRARLDPSESVRHGRTFGEQGSILCGQTRVQGRDPPAFSARNAGKSLITYSSIRHRVGPSKTTSVPTAKVLPFVDQKPKRASGAGGRSLHRSGIEWPGEARRALLWVKDSPAAVRASITPAWQRFPCRRPTGKTVPRDCSPPRQTWDAPVGQDGSGRRGPAHRVIVRGHIGHAERRRSRDCSFPASQNLRQPRSALSIPYVSPPLQPVSQLAFSRHQSLTKSVRRLGPAEDDFPGIQL